MMMIRFVLYHDVKNRQSKNFSQIISFVSGFCRNILFSMQIKVKIFDMTKGIC